MKKSTTSGISVHGKTLVNTYMEILEDVSPDSMPENKKIENSTKVDSGSKRTVEGANDEPSKELVTGLIPKQEYVSSRPVKRQCRRCRQEAK